MLEEKIEALGAYFDGMFRLPQGYNGVRICMPENWAVYEQKTDEFTITPTPVIENNTKKMMFVGSPEAKIIDIMNFAYKVILNNLENEKKKELFKTRVQELVNIFDNNQLSTLETLVFSFEKPKPVKNNKTAKKMNKEVVTEGLAEVKPETETEVEVKEVPEIKPKAKSTNLDDTKLAEIRKLSQEK